MSVVETVAQNGHHHDGKEDDEYGDELDEFLGTPDGVEREDNDDDAGGASQDHYSGGTESAPDGDVPTPTAALMGSADDPDNNDQWKLRANQYAIDLSYEGDGESSVENGAPDDDDEGEDEEDHPRSDALIAASLAKDLMDTLLEPYASSSPHSELKLSTVESLLQQLNQKWVDIVRQTMEKSEEWMQEQVRVSSEERHSQTLKHEEEVQQLTHLLEGYQEEVEELKTALAAASQSYEEQQHLRRRRRQHQRRRQARQAARQKNARKSNQSAHDGDQNDDVDAAGGKNTRTVGAGEGEDEDESGRKRDEDEEDDEDEEEDDDEDEEEDDTHDVDTSHLTAGSTVEVHEIATQTDDSLWQDSQKDIIEKAVEEERFKCEMAQAHAVADSAAVAEKEYRSMLQQELKQQDACHQEELEALKSKLHLLENHQLDQEEIIRQAVEDTMKREKEIYTLQLQLQEQRQAQHVARLKEELKVAQLEAARAKSGVSHVEETPPAEAPPLSTPKNETAPSKETNHGARRTTPSSARTTTPQRRLDVTKSETPASRPRRATTHGTATHASSSTPSSASARRLSSKPTASTTNSSSATRKDAASGKSSVSTPRAGATPSTRSRMSTPSSTTTTTTTLRKPPASSTTPANDRRSSRLPSNSGSSTLKQKPSTPPSSAGKPSITGSRASPANRTRSAVTKQQQQQSSGPQIPNLDAPASPTLSPSNIRLLILVPVTDKIKRMASSLEIPLVSDPFEATHVIAADHDHPLRRTTKIMMSLCLTSNILHMDWLRQSHERRGLLRCSPYLLHENQEAVEAHLGIHSLRTTLRRGIERRRANGGLLAGWRIFITAQVAGNRAPPLSELQQLIRSAGGSVLPNEVVEDETASALGEKVLVLTSHPPLPAQLSQGKAAMARGAVGCFSTDWLFQSIMNQQLTGLAKTNNTNNSSSNGGGDDDENDSGGDGSEEKGD